MKCHRFTVSASFALCLFAGAPAMAADWNLAPVNNAPKPVAVAPETTAQDSDAQSAATQAYVKTAEFTMPSPAEPVQDGLRADHRWAAMERCINSATQATFNSCLAAAFMQDGTGTSGSLSLRRR